MTPIRRQYLQIKRRYPEAIVLFRLGDFYETFDDDAKLVSRELEITLTSKPMGKGLRVPLAGIPYHAVDGYLARLVNKGYKVAICEQLTDPKESRGLVERDVVRVVTPGTVVEPNLLQGKANNYLAALALGEGQAGIAYIDITTSEFATTQLPLSGAQAELARLQPAEVLAAKEAETPDWLTGNVSRVEPAWFGAEDARQALLQHFGASTLEGFGCEGLPLAIAAAGAIVRYLQETQKPALKVSRLSTYSTQSFMVLDAQTRRNLELFQAGRQGTSAGSLLSVLDLTRTAMGGRLLRRWLSQPLLDIAELTRRQDAVEWCHKDAMARTKVVAALGSVADLERLANRIGSGIATPRELVALRRSLEAVPELRSILGETEGPLSWLISQLKPCPELVELIARAIVDDPPAAVSEGVVRSSFSDDLDKLRSASRNAKQYLANLERQERERTGIKSLKVGYNRVFGYYIEVSKPNMPQVPQDYIRKQTLVNGERFFTAELKEYESTILNAQERIEELETSIFRQVCQQIASQGQRLLELGQAVAQLDVFAALGEVASRHGYCRPQLTTDDTISIAGGRHPVVEQALADGSFVPNDTYLSNRDAQVLIITGPNMSGKSTYLRQVALIVLLAQVGSFVPAQSASIGLVDRIFTRVGLQDDLVSGQSTFMVEMVETANILNNATPHSLIVLDEIGRGTSTYDGISIAHAVAEYIHNNPRLGAKTLFATHYHELVELARYLPRVRNLNVAVSEEGGKVVFLRRIVPGGADKSYGIHVAQLAGLPRPVIGRAQEILSGLEGGRADGARPVARKKAKPEAQQLPLLGAPSPLLEELSQLDVDSLSPLDAITKLYELRKKAREG